MSSHLEQEIVWLVSKSVYDLYSGFGQLTSQDGSCSVLELMKTLGTGFLNIRVIRFCTVI